MHSSTSPVLRFMDRFVDPVLLLLAVVAIPLLVVETGPTTPDDAATLARLNWLIWLAFTVNFVVRVAVAPDRRAEARYLAWDLLIIVAQPLLALFGLGDATAAPLVRLVVVLVRAASRGAMARRGWDAARRSPLKLALGLTPVLWLTSAAVVYRLEVSGNGAIESLSDALWWGAATLTTVGYGDVTPTSSAARGVAILTMLGGISLFSVVTASLADSFVASRLGRRTRSVPDTNHVVIIGRSRKVAQLLLHLCEAARVRHEVATIVVLSDAPLEELNIETGLLRRLTRQGHAIDLRTGSTSDPDELRHLGAGQARAVMLVSDGPDQDSRTIRSLLALGQLHHGQEHGVPVIAEIHEHGRVREMRSVADSLMTVLDTPMFLSRAAARACWAPGALTAYRALLSPDGPSLLRVSAERAATESTDADGAPAPIVTIRRGDDLLLGAGSTGRTVPDDQVVVLAATPDPRSELRAPSPEDSELIRRPLGLLHEEPAATPQSDDAVILGWNDLAPSLALMMVETVSERSKVRIAVDLRHPELDAAQRWAATHPRCDVVEWDRVNDTTTSMEMADGCGRAVILADRYRDPTDSDATGLLTMLQLRGRSGGEGTAALGVICELADPASSALVAPLANEELLIREELVSMLLTQFATDPHLHTVFETLLMADTSDAGNRSIR